MLQLEAFRAADSAPFGVSWSDLYPDWSIPPYLPEEEAVAAVRKRIDSFVNDRDRIDILRDRLRVFARDDWRHHDPGPGRHYREQLGLGGPAEAARYITELLGGLAT